MKTLSVLAALALFLVPACTSKTDTAPAAVVVEPGKSETKPLPVVTVDGAAVTATPAATEAPTTVKVTETMTPAVPATGEPAKTVTETNVSAPADAKVTVAAPELKSAK